MKRTIIGLSLFFAAIEFGCGCSGDGISGVDPGGGAASRTIVTVRASRTNVSKAAEESTAVADGTSSTEPGGLKGQILFDGPVPKLPSRVAKGTSKSDPAICAHQVDIPDESLIVSEIGGLANVFVYLDKAPEWFKGQTEAGPELDQKACIFLPHALIAPVGVAFKLKNSDLVSHNVQTNPSVNSAQNELMGPESTMTMLLKRPEKTPFQSSCKIHPWMEFYTLTLAHPFSAVSDADGRFDISGLQPGKYKFRVWHERGKNLETIIVEIKGGESKDVALKYGRDRFGL